MTRPAATLAAAALLDPVEHVPTRRGNLRGSLGVASVMTSLVRAALTLGFVSAAFACHDPSNTITYRVSLRETGAPSEISAITRLAGSELFLEGRSLGKLRVEDGKMAVALEWSGPKSEARQVAAGRFAVGTSGVCGAAKVPVDAPPDNLEATSDEALAKAVSAGGTLPILLHVRMPRTLPLYIDWGHARGALAVGTEKVEPGTQRVDVVVEGCTSGPTVTLDGASLGALDVSTRGALVTVEPGVCHVLQDVAFGDPPVTKDAVHLPAKGVVPLTHLASHFLKPASSSPDFGKGPKGAFTSELVREPCR